MKIHIVKKGDTLYKLAQQYHVDLQQLIEANPIIADPDQLVVGLKVKIPSPAVPVHEPPSADKAYKHIVKQGDTLWKLAQTWGIPLSTLIQFNPQLKNPNVLLTGEIIYIPKAGTEVPHGGQTPAGMNEEPATVSNANEESPNPISNPISNLNPNPNPNPIPNHWSHFLESGPEAGSKSPLPDFNLPMTEPPAMEEAQAEAPQHMSDADHKINDLFAQYKKPAIEAADISPVMPLSGSPLGYPSSYGPAVSPYQTYPSHYPYAPAPYPPAPAAGAGDCGCGGGPADPTAWPPMQPYAAPAAWPSMPPYAAPYAPPMPYYPSYPAPGYGSPFGMPYDPSFVSPHGVMPMESWRTGAAAAPQPSAHTGEESQATVRSSVKGEEPAKKHKSRKASASKAGASRSGRTRSGGRREKIAADNFPWINS